MELALSTGNTIVDQISEMNFTGNIIPAEWFKTLRGPNGKPMLLAIDILSDILYWYRPTEVRDERTGALVGYKKKFKNDFLQRSYRQIEDQFGVSKKQARLALDFLCGKGVIKKHLVDETTKDGMKLHNNMYLELVPEKLKEMTYIHRSSEGVSLKAPPYVFDDNTLVSYKAEGDDLQGITSTENTTEITTKEYNNPINLKTDGNFYVRGPSGYRGKPVKQIDEMDEITAYRDVIKENIDYENLRASQGSEAEQKRIDEIYEIICDVVCSKKGTIRVGGEDKPLELVKSVFLKLTSEPIEYVTECLDRTYSDIGNIRSYLITALYRSIQTAENFNNQKVNHGQHEFAMKNMEQGGTYGETIEKRNCILQFRLSEREKEILEKRMELVGVKRRSAFIRKQVLCGYIISLDLSDMKEIVRLMRINSNNLNQYAKKANETGSIFIQDINELKDQQEKIWDAINDLLGRLAKIA